MYLRIIIFLFMILSYKCDLETKTILTQNGDLCGVVWYILREHHLVDTKGQDDRDLQ